MRAPISLSESSFMKGSARFWKKVTSIGAGQGRRINAGLFHSVDGVIGAPNLWQGHSFDAELLAEPGSGMSHVDTVILGRVRYQKWAPRLADADDPIGG